MTTKYQFILIGNNNALKGIITDTFKKRVQNLGMKEDAIIILDEASFKKNYRGNAPAVALYFGGDGGSGFSNLDILDTLIADSSFVLPVVNDLKKFTALVPKQLIPINGFELKSEMEVESLVSNILE